MSEKAKFIPIANTYIGQEEADAVYNVVKSGWISMGKKVQEFEHHLCDYLGVNHAIAFNNGTSSLHAGLIALGVDEGDEVLLQLFHISAPQMQFYTVGQSQCSAKLTRKHLI